jgi:phytoene/squalene synthetase
MTKDILKTLRAHDYERYVCALMEPARVQPRMFALLALNQELASTVEAASEPAVGAIRLKWWQEALAGGKPLSEHPLLPLLAQAEVGEQACALIEARMAELEHQKGFEDLAQFNDYLRSSAGTLHQLLAQDESEIVAQAGAFFALVGVLRALPYHLERGIVRLPKDVLQRHGISPAAIEAGLEKEAFAHLMSFWASELQTRADALRADIKTAPKLIKRLHLAALLYARALQKAQNNPAALPRRLPNLPLRLWCGR